MNILITGADGFVGKNLCVALKNIRDGKDRRRPLLQIGQIFRYGRDDTDEALATACAEADFVFHLAGVNRPKDPAAFASGNAAFTEHLLELLRKQKKSCPVMLASSVQASLEGRYAGSLYGESKLRAEKAVFAYGEETGARVLVYRFPNLFGKWCRPNYNSVVATFCHNVAHDLPIRVEDPAIELELAHIDDVVEELLGALEGQETRRGRFCAVPVTHRASLGEIASLLQAFARQPQSLLVPEIPDGSFAKKLYSTYLSYLPAEKVCFPLRMNVDERGSFTELLKTVSGGQFSVNISKPGITKGQHWHNSKWEFFIVVSGRALIRERKLGTDEVLSFTVSGEKIEAVHMLPGCTHSITNLSDTEDLVTLMWANERFDPGRPDTFFEPVSQEGT